MSETTKAPEEKKGPTQKEKIKKILGDGVKSAKQAVDLMKALELKPVETYKGKPVEHLFCSEDGQFFYTEAAAKDHMRLRQMKSVFTVKL